jgi:hypothetical protein
MGLAATLAPRDDGERATEHEPEDAAGVTASEFSFLALGLVLGLISGAAIIEVVRARPAAPREVRLTVSHDAIRRRSSTLADEAFSAAGPEPARGGPADRRLIGSPLPVGTPDRRTTVRFSPAGATTAAAAGGPDFGGMIGVPVSTGEDPVMSAINSGPVPVAASVAATADVAETGADMAREVERANIVATTYEAIGAHAPTPVEPPTTDALPAPVAARPTRLGSMPAADATPTPAESSGPPTSSDPATEPIDSERCADERRIADERCELATRARAQAEAASDALRQAQRTYDAHEAAAVTASWGADPRAIHEAKDAAQGGFRLAVQAARTPDALEIAARDWLDEINRINTEARDATATAAREHAAAAAIGATLERLGLEADAARIGAENADAACLQARILVAECDERNAADAAGIVPAGPSEPWPPRPEDDETIGIAFEAGGMPRIFRLLRGDRQAMTSLVAALADDDAEARRRWQLQITGLVEAIVADAIEASALDFPADHPFWSGFTRVQCRDIAHALASLGFRFDGLGGWTDERFPSQRDLSLALGYAGLDPMRVRQWPTAAETAALFQGVTVTADEYLAAIAGDLTLAEMVKMLGRRADGLAEVWNQWGRIRPLLLEEG